MSFIEKSYESHRASKGESLPNFVLTGDFNESENYITKEMDRLLPLIKEFKDSSWLTIGDGRYGGEAFFLIKQGLKDVTASDICIDSLLIAKEKGIISQISEENAEKLSFKDNSIDFVLCKASYHHFPRPSIAFYEMLRVSKIGLVLIEPIEASPKILDSFRFFVKSVLRKDKNYMYEESGNFVYRVSIRELEKMMLSLNYPVIAYKSYNSFYMAGINGFMKIFEKFIYFLGKFIQDFLSVIKLMNYGTSCIICFKEDLDDKRIKELKRNGYKIRKLTRNPYIK